MAPTLNVDDALDSSSASRWVEMAAKVRRRRSGMQRLAASARDDPSSTSQAAPGATERARQMARRRHPSRGIPRGDQRSRLTFELDRSLAVLFFRVGRYPLHHGTVGAIRSLGRAGVPVFAVTEDRYTPAAVSRYLTSHVALDTTGCERPASILERLVELGRGMPDKPLVICTDDEAAVLVGEGAADLREYFVLPDVPPGLPRELASKRGLVQLCERYGLASPKTCFPTTMSELEALRGSLDFPVVVKNIDPWLRLSRPAVTGTTIVSSWSELRAVAHSWSEPFCGLVQEYLPDADSEDWIVHGYWGTDEESQVVFVGRKLRSWPPHFGATAYARVERNPELVELTTRLCAQTGYRGIFDLDWRLDKRSGRYHLLDFNPRLGAQFRLFEDDGGVDVVRAMHLDLSGRAVPLGNQIDGDRFMVENLDLASRRAYRRAKTPGVNDDGGSAVPPRLAWIASDDPAPVVFFLVRQAWMSIVKRLGIAVQMVRVRRAPARRSSAGH